MPETGGESEGLTESSECPEGEHYSRAEDSPPDVEPGEAPSQQEGAQVHCRADQVGQREGSGGGRGQHQRQEGQQGEEGGHRQPEDVAGAPGHCPARAAVEEVELQRGGEEQEDQGQAGQHHQVEAGGEVGVLGVPGQGGVPQGAPAHLHSSPGKL